MEHKLLARLEAAVATASSQKSRGNALIDLAIALAQIGRMDTAESIIADIREKYDFHEIPSLAIRLLTLEAIVQYYKNRSDDSLDRIKRARALSHSLGLESICGEVAVWYAHLCFNFDLYTEFSDAIAEGLQHFSSISNRLAGRLALTVADCCQVAGKWQQAMLWYGFARNLSRIEHDQPLLVAVEFNRLACGISRSRLEEILELEDHASVARSWLVELTSVSGLHAAFGSRSMPNLLELCKARIASLAGDYSGAAQALTTLCDVNVAHACGSSPLSIEAELAWLRLMQGDREPAARLALLGLNGLLEESANAQLEILYFLSKMVGLGVGYMSAAMVERLNSLRSSVLSELHQLEDIAKRVEDFEEMVVQRANG